LYGSYTSHPDCDSADFTTQNYFDYYNPHILGNEYEDYSASHHAPGGIFYNHPQMPPYFHRPAAYPISSFYMQSGGYPHDINTPPPIYPNYNDKKYAFNNETENQYQ